MNFARYRCDRRATQRVMRKDAFQLRVGNFVAAQQRFFARASWTAAATAGRSNGRDTRGGANDALNSAAPRSGRANPSVPLMAAGCVGASNTRPLRASRTELRSRSPQGARWDTLPRSDRQQPLCTVFELKFIPLLYANHAWRKTSLI